MNAFNYLNDNKEIMGEKAIEIENSIDLNKN